MGQLVDELALPFELPESNLFAHLESGPSVINRPPDPNQSSLCTVESCAVPKYNN